MTTLLFYNEPVGLNREAHRALCYSDLKDYSFTEQVNSVPLTGIEFFEASRDYPVLFSKDEDGNFFPLTLLSLLPKGHKQLSGEGEWTDSYIPAFVRRYPFALTDDGTVCLDKQAPHFNELTEGDNEASGERLFSEEGENTKALDNIINFLNSYDQQHKNTRQYCDEAKELELFRPFNIQVILVENQPVRLDGLYVIDEQRLDDLSAEQVNEWFRSGWLAWTYAHLHSLGALNRLVKRQQSETSSPAEEE